MAEIKYICCHHYGGTSNPKTPTAHFTEENINTAHKERWPDFPSELNGSFIGYNFIIYPSGLHKQYRLIGEETAAQKGHNFDTVSICLAGNFTKGVETPTVAQKIKLKALCQAIKNNHFGVFDLRVRNGTVINILDIVPHRVLQPNHTDCYGSSLTDSWAREVVAGAVYDEVLVKKLQNQLKLLLEQLKAYLNKNKVRGLVESCFTSNNRG